MPVDNSSPLKPYRSRSRRGCLTCRQHRLKCDEKSPRCGSCSRLERRCQWGLKASFHPSRVCQLSSSDSTILGEIELGRQHRNTLAFVDETEEIEREYIRPDEALVQHESSRGGTGDSSARESEGHCPDVINEHHVHHLPPIPDLPIYTTRNNISLINIISEGENHGNYEKTPPQEVLAWPINDHVKACLLSSYFQHTSRWCEVTNSLQPFSTLSSHLVLESQAFAAAAVALASVTATSRDAFSVLLTKDLYAFARQTLQCVKSEHCEGSLLAITILYIYCSALGRTNECQSTRDECAELLQANSPGNAGDSLWTACFWAFVRQDVWEAYFSGRPTLILTETWKVIPPGVSQVPIQDTYSNLAIWITARIVNELSSQSSDINEITLHNLWEELQAWVIERPISVRCIMEVEASGDSAFPTILFSNPSAVCGNIHYHTGCILLLETGKIPDKSSAMASPICHARRIAGISATNNNQVAARHIPAAIEKIAILKHLREIEDLTGWKTTSYILELKKLWGLG
ncbi:hypothetical protein O988_00581 [Pseudogymnoascus sp. VKM F-3808]|nr:hypothetical protein O988_00581 [Pseudogymnoascus sp. VKM F-3808]